jgi:uncharacterized membrane protein
MACVGVRVERPVRLGRVVEGVEYTPVQATLILWGLAIGVLLCLLDRIASFSQQAAWR